jgi:anti-sigma factor ChrR (cupin superfamily)
MNAHLDELGLFDLALGALAPEALRAAEEHVSGCLACAAELRLARDLVTGAVPEAAPQPALRARVLASAARPLAWGRWGRELAQLLDLQEAEVERLLRDAADPTRWTGGADPQPGVDLFPVRPGPRWAVPRGARAYLVRIAPGTALLHRHVGDEHCLYLEGAIEDAEGRVSRPGDLVVLPGGSLHDFRVLAEGAVAAIVSHGLTRAG